jgi:integrase/recombinase XerD
VKSDPTRIKRWWLLRFASEQRRKAPTRLRIEDLDAELIGDFLIHVETARQNGARSRNTRLAAIRSFFRYVAMNEPTHLLHCQRILTMPGKRYVKRTVTFLDREEIAALLAALTGRHGSGAAITQFWWSPCRPGCEPPS